MKIFYVVFIKVKVFMDFYLYIYRVHKFILYKLCSIYVLYVIHTIFTFFFNFTDASVYIYICVCISAWAWNALDF